MKISGLDHIVIRCCDVETMIRFYDDVLGCCVEKRVETLGLIHLRAGASLIDLIDINGELGRAGGSAPADQGRNMDHLCLRLESFDIDALRERFHKFGLDIGKVHNNYGAEGNGPSVYLKDPEGNTVELKGPASSMGEDVDATVLVSSVRGYTARSESISIDEFAIWTNRLLYDVTESLLQFKGTPVKYMGEGMLGYFSGDKHNQRAIRAALHAASVISEPLVISLSSGLVHRLLIGHPTHARPDILGPVVNEAFRIHAWVQSETQSGIGAAEQTIENQRGLFEFGKTATVELRGFAQPRNLYEILGIRGKSKQHEDIDASGD